MLYAGRPELPLPPAPDTLALGLFRALLASFGSALFTLIAGLAWLSSLYGEVYSAFLTLALVPTPVWVCAFFAYLGVRQNHEERYWTPRRVARFCPAIWRLYTACNDTSPGTGPRPVDLRR